MGAGTLPGALFQPFSQKYRKPIPFLSDALSFFYRLAYPIAGVDAFPSVTEKVDAYTVLVGIYFLTK